MTKKEQAALKAAIALVLEKHQDLNDNGFDCSQYSEHHQKWRKIYPGMVIGVLGSLEFIDACEAIRKMKTPLESSYQLKHRAERRAGKYITNGQFIIAALIRNLPIKRRHNDPNCEVAISRKALAKLSRFGLAGVW